MEAKVAKVETVRLHVELCKAGNVWTIAKQEHA